jgi:GH18 family chitinase
MEIRTVAFFLIGLAGVCSAQEMPAGWTKPAPKLTRQEFRRNAPNHFLVVTGDFNGDGISDNALLLVNQHTQKLGFFICLTTVTGCDWHRLEVMDIGFLEVMGIAKVKPGQYETACGKGYWECGKDEPKKLSTRRDAVEFFKDESASSVYVYNPRKQKFISVATSD